MTLAPIIVSSSIFGVLAFIVPTKDAVNDIAAMIMSSLSMLRQHPSAARVD